MVHGGTALSAAIERRVRAEATKSPVLEVKAPVKDPAALLPARRLIESLYKQNRSKPGVSVRVSSNLPLGAGLGSSAASMVAIAGAISALEGWGLEGADLAKAAGVGEALVHGNPSGIDAATSALGGVLLFRRGEPARPVDVDSSTELVVVFSGRRRSTGRLISKVGEMRKAYPSLFAGLADGATLVSGLSSTALAKGDIETLGRLMTYNHAVLSRAGASTKQLDSLVDLCIGSGCLGAKLTGAGGGGSVIAAPPQGTKARAIAERLVEDGYDAFLTSVPTSGARSWTE